MPPVSLTYIIELWSECGLSADWQTIQSWSSVTKTSLSYWESASLRAMANSYQFAMAEYHETNSVPPFILNKKEPKNGSILARAKRG